MAKSAQQKKARGEGKWKRRLSPDAGEHTCTRSDKALWIQHAHDDFEADMNYCAPLCMGNVNCVGRCASRRQPELSKSCTREYGLLANCGVKKCWWQCVFSTQKDGCEACFHKNCNPGFFNRTGLDATEPLAAIEVGESNASSSSVAYLALLCVLVMVIGLPRFRRALRLDADSEQKSR